MFLERTTEYGNIRINNNIFAKIVMKAVSKTGGKTFCASERGKILGGIDQKVSGSELSSNIFFAETDECYILKFFLIMSFGASIKENCALIFDELEKELKLLLPDKKGRIIIKIVGVKSKRIASRDIELKREYDV